MHSIRPACLLGSFLILATIQAVSQTMLGVNASDYAAKAEQEAKFGKISLALADYEKAISLDPSYVKAYIGRGSVRLEAQDSEGSIADFSKAIELSGHTPSRGLLYYYYYLRGVAKSTKGELDGAMEDFTKAIELRPDFGAAYNRRGIERLEKGDKDGGQADLSKAEQLNHTQSRGKERFQAAQIEPEVNSGKYFYDRAVRESVSGDKDSAFADFTKAIKAFPFSAWAYYERALLSYDWHDFPSALADFGKVEELTAKDTLFENSIRLETIRDYNHLRLWLCEARLKRMEAANERLKAYLRIRPRFEHFDWQGNLAGFLVGTVTEADLLNAAANSDPKTTDARRCEAYFYIATVHLIAGDKAIAVDYYKQCVSKPFYNSREYVSAEAELQYLQPKP
jgi:tetratricopeptide (TPR) repeat protein